MDGLKQRIVGALVLVSLAVIFVPMLFDEPRQSRTTQTIDIPEQPAFPEVRVEKPKPPANEDPIEPVALPENATTDTEGTSKQWSLEEIPEEPEPRPEPVDKPASQAQPEVAEAVPDLPESEPSRKESTEHHSQSSLKGAWVIQLGSFGNMENANRLRDSVIEKGYDAYTTQYESNGKTLTRVISGPFAKKTLAEAAKTRLDKAFSINSLVMEGGE